MLEDLTTRLDGLLLTDQPEMVSAVIDLNPQSPLDLTQMFVQLTTEVCQPVIIFRAEHQIDEFGVIGHDRRHLNSGR